MNKYPIKTPTGLSEINLFSIDFYALSDEACCQMQNTGNIVKIAIFNMATMKKCRKMKNWNFRKF